MSPPPSVTQSLTAGSGGSSDTRSDGAGLVDAVEAWIADDPDPRDQAELRALIDEDARARLSSRRWPPSSAGR
jgi:uncharacterized protein (DUF2235 family)